MPITIREVPVCSASQRVIMNRKTYQQNMLYLLVIFGICALFSIMAFFMALIAVCK